MLDEIIKNMRPFSTYELPNGRTITRTKDGYTGFLKDGTQVKFDENGEQVIEWLEMENHGETVEALPSSKWFGVVALVLVTIVAFVVTR